jgi:hypothetical protein
MIRFPGRKASPTWSGLVAEHELQVESRQEEPGEHRAGPEDADGVRDRDVPTPEEAQRHERRAHASLYGEEGDEQDRRDREQSQRPPGQPADVVPVHDGIDREHQSGRHGHRTGQVELSGCGRDACTRNHDECQDDDEDADGDVDEEDPVPVERVREDAAEQDAKRAAAGGDEAEDAHGLRPLRRAGEQRHHQRQGDGRHDRAAEALHGARGDEHALRAREPADGRGNGEEPDPGEKQGPMAEQVAEPAPEQEKAPEGDQVRVDHPRERLFREAEIRSYRWERDPDDRNVEDDHQVAEAEDEQREPPPVGETISALRLDRRVVKLGVRHGSSGFAEASSPLLYRLTLG